MAEDRIEKAIDIMKSCYFNRDEDFWTESIKSLEMLGYSEEDLEDFCREQDLYFAGDR